MPPTGTASDAPRISTYLKSNLSPGEPATAGPLTVFPVFGPEPELEYVPFADAHANGAQVKELDTGASVNDLIVINPTDSPILIFAGEEVIGAQQDRIFDVTVLVGPGKRVRVPVSCVEAGRWDGSRHRESFQPAPHAAAPNLRRQNSRSVRENVAAGREARGDQGHVWNAVDEQAHGLGVNSPTRAMRDSFDQRRNELNEIAGAIPLHEGQSGTLAAIGNTISVLDWVSRPDTFASLKEALVLGYALDALRAQPATRPTDAEAEGFVTIATDATATERDGVDLGRELRFARHNLTGAGLASDRELIQLTVHTEDPDAPEGPSRTRRVARPSRRR